MKHYGIVEWVDFARDVVTGKDEAGMSLHLASGCIECRRLVEFCDAVYQVSRSTVPASVPEWAVSRAKAAIPVRSAQKSRRPLFLPVELAYDSFVAPAPAGLRASWQVGWQGLYHTAECSLDLRIEPELKSSRAAVIGQITSRTAARMEMESIPVCLKLGKQVIAETVSNRFGEFQMEYEQQGHLNLCVLLGGARCIQVPLRKLAADYPLGGERFKLAKSKKNIGNRSRSH